MGLLVRAVVYGFGFSVGVALYKRLSDQLGLEKSEQPKEQQPQAAPPVGSSTGDGGNPANAHA
jgi:hypothetical protein